MSADSTVKTRLTQAVRRHNETIHFPGGDVVEIAGVRWPLSRALQRYIAPAGKSTK